MKTPLLQWFRYVTILTFMLSLFGSVATYAQETGGIIKIATQGPLSGSQSAPGNGLRNAAELALAQHGDRLREMGFELQLVAFDDQALPETGVANAQSIVSDPSILAVIGHWNTGVAVPASEVYNQYDLVMVSPANVGPVLTDRGLPTVNRVVGRSDSQGAVGARFVAELGTIETVYILHDTTSYGQDVAEFFRRDAEAAGLTVVTFEGTEERSNFDSILQPILALNPDLIYMGGIFDQWGIFASQARAAGYTGQLMGPDGLDSPDYAELAGDAAVGTYYTSVAGPASLYPNAAQFIEDYTATYGEAPTPFAAQSYDSAGVVLAALERIVTENGGVLPTRAEVTAAVRATEGYEGITGTVTFDDAGDPEVSTYYVLQVVSSDPAAWSDNTVIRTIEIPSPLHAQELAPEATPES
jgi:branched-chain amino acid transport system substrate-binding protein